MSSTLIVLLVTAKKHLLISIFSLFVIYFIIFFFCGVRLVFFVCLCFVLCFVLPLFCFFVFCLSVWFVVCSVWCVLLLLCACWRDFLILSSLSPLSLLSLPSFSSCSSLNHKRILCIYDHVFALYFKCHAMAFVLLCVYSSWSFPREHFVLRWIVVLFWWNDDCCWLVEPNLN